jgi:hypothetical protein
MAERVEYGSPKRINAVSITFLLLLTAAGYWMWRFFPAYFDGWSVDHILKETAAAIYRANRLREPERTETLKELVDKAKSNIVKNVGITDPDLDVGLEIEETKATMTAEYSVIITHPMISKTTTLHFKKAQEANIKTVKWD